MKHLGSRNRKKRIDVSDFGVNSELPGVTLGSLWASEGDIGAPWVVLSSLWAHFGITLGPIGSNFGHMAVPLGHLGVTLESLWSIFKKTLVSLQILMI